MSRIACFSCFTFAELPAAQVMARSLKRVHPDWELWAIIPDLPPAGLGAAALAMFDKAMDGASMRLAARPAWLFGHTAAQAKAAMQPWMLAELLAGGTAAVVHLSPGMAVFASLQPWLDTAGDAAVILSPHHRAPAASQAVQRERETRAAVDGLYDPGLLAVRANAEGEAFAAWWQARLEAPEEWAAEGVGKLHDLAPSLFGARVSRDAGCNVAPWNLAERPISVDAVGDFSVAGVKLRCMQFAAVPPEGKPGDHPIAEELVSWHAEAVRRAALHLPAPAAWAWACFEDGTPIPAAARAVYRQRRDLRLAFPNPFAAGDCSFAAWLRTEMPLIMEPAA